MVLPKVGNLYRVINKKLDEDFIVKIVEIRENTIEKEFYDASTFSFCVLKWFKKSMDYSRDSDLKNENDDKFYLLTDEEKDKLMVELL